MQLRFLITSKSGADANHTVDDKSRCAGPRLRSAGGRRSEVRSGLPHHHLQQIRHRLRWKLFHAKFATPRIDIPQSPSAQETATVLNVFIRSCCTPQPTSPRRNAETTSDDRRVRTPPTIGDDGRFSTVSVRVIMSVTSTAASCGFADVMDDSNLRRCDDRRLALECSITHLRPGMASGRWCGHLQRPLALLGDQRLLNLQRPVCASSAPLVVSEK